MSTLIAPFICPKRLGELVSQLCAAVDVEVCNKHERAMLGIVGHCSRDLSQVANSSKHAAAEERYRS